MKLILTEKTGDSEAVIDLRMSCVKLQLTNKSYLEQSNSLAKELFDIDHRKCIDLSKYLRKLKTYIPKDTDLIYNFFVSAKRFA